MAPKNKKNDDHGDETPKRSVQERFKKKLGSYDTLIQGVTIGRLTRYQRFTAYLAIGTAMVDVPIILNNVSWQVLLIINVPLLLSVLVVAFLAIHASYSKNPKLKPGGAKPPKS